MFTFPNSIAATWTYDGNGNVLSVTDALGHKTHFSYDALDRVATATDAAGGITRYAQDRGQSRLFGKMVPGAVSQHDRL